MSKQIINKENGEFTINDSFIVSKKTRLSDLQLHFRNDQLIQSEYIPNCYYSSAQIEIDKLFFKFSFIIENETVQKIIFEIETEPINRIAWANNRDVETAWIKAQMNDESNFNWDSNPECNQYILSYNWGITGVFHDFKNGTYQSFLTYKTN
jgi:hypothetical protein